MGFDINQEIIDYVESRMNPDDSILYDIHNCDVTSDKFKECINVSLEKFNKSKVDFFIAHPPYMDIVKFTNHECDLSRLNNLDRFLDKFMCSMHNAYSSLSNNKYFAVVIGDVYKNSEILPLGFYVMNAIKQQLNVKLKGTIIKNIEGNRGKLGINSIWRTRALRSDYFIFKHEYIFVFKKLE